MGRRKTIQEAFEEFHASNPHVYAALVRLARRARANGHTRFGIEILFGALRWEWMMARPDDPSQAVFKLNDHYTSRYARLIMAQETDLEGLFETRALRSHGPNRLYDSAPIDDDGQVGMPL